MRCPRYRPLLCRIADFLCNPLAPNVVVAKAGNLIELLVSVTTEGVQAMRTVHAVFICAKVCAASSTATRFVPAYDWLILVTPLR